MSFAVLLRQISVIFLEILFGFVGAKFGKLTERDTKFMSSLLMTFFLPCTVLSGLSSEGAGGAVGVMFVSIGIFCLFFIISTFICRFLASVLKLSWQKEAVLVGTAAMPNNGFVGLPMACAVMGGMGPVYGAASIAAYNLWFFTYVDSLFRGKHKLSFRELVTPCNVCTLIMLFMLALGLRFPEPAANVCSAMGACTTPLALMIVGAMLARSNIRAIAARPILYGITFLRNILFPLGFMLVLKCLPLSVETCLGLSIISASPSGTLAAVLARQNDVEENLCSQAVAHSTLFMALTMPLMILLALHWFPLG